MIPLAAENLSPPLSAYLRGGIDPDDSMGFWRLRVRFHDASGSLLSNFSEVTFGSPGSLTTSWAQKSGSFTTPDNAASVSVWLMNYMNSGWVAFDDVSLVAAPGVKTTSYFYAGGQRVAMRRSDGVSSTVSYIVGDHLGSAAILADASGNKIGEMLYRPWGELRYSWGSLPTEQRFTGQRRESALGLYDYGARFYDPALGRFITADSIVPGVGNSQAWDRFAYCFNNPVRYTDPLGHVPNPQPLIDGLYNVDYATDHADYVGETPVGQEPDMLGEGTYKASKVMIEYIKSRQRSEQMLLDGLTGATIIVDGTAMVISYGEQIFVDGVATILLLGCVYGPEMCGPAVALVLDLEVATTTVAGIVENPLGGISFGITFFSDWLQGNNTFSSIGVDTLVSGRNALLGMIPEVNIDAWTSQSQFGYDLDRLSGAEPGGAIPFSDTGQILLQLIWYDTFWEEAFGNIFPH